MLGSIEAGKRLGNFAVHVLDRAQHSLAEIALVVAIAQLNRLVLARGSPAGHGGAAAGTIGEEDLGFHGRVSAGIENLSGGDLRDRGHTIRAAEVSFR